MVKKIIGIISYLLHPLLIPFYLFVVLLNYHNENTGPILYRGKLILEGMVFLITAVLPFVTGYFLYSRKLIQTFSLEKKEERIYPLINTAVFYYLSYYMLKGGQLPAIYSYLMLGWTFLVICAIVISFFYKISLYMISMGSITGVLLGLTIGHGFSLTLFLLIFIFLTGVTAWSRLKAEHHKPSEVYAGFLMGFSVMFCLFYFI